MALPLLEDLVSHFNSRIELVGIFTQPDRRSGRGMKVHANPVKQWAVKNNVAVRQPFKIGEEDYNWLESLSCELILVMSYGHIFKQRLLDIPKYKVLNIHPSILPAYRGTSPVEGALASGDRETGVTFMETVLKMDAGPLIGCELISLGDQETRLSLREKVSLAAVPLIRRCLPGVLDGSVRFEPQKDEKATFTRLLRKEDAALDFRAPARVLANRVRALHPWPGSFFEIDGLRIKIGSATYLESLSGNFETNSILAQETMPHAGLVMGKHELGLMIACGEGIFIAHEMQRPGGRMIFARDFLRGHAIPEGSQCALFTMKPLVSARPWMKRKKS